MLTTESEALSAAERRLHKGKKLEKVLANPGYQATLRKHVEATSVEGKHTALVDRKEEAQRTKDGSNQDGLRAQASVNHDN